MQTCTRNGRRVARFCACINIWMHRYHCVKVVSRHTNAYQNMQAMSAQLQSLVETQKAMRVAREQRLAQMEVANEEARAEYMVQKVLRQQVCESGRHIIMCVRLR